MNSRLRRPVACALAVAAVLTACITPIERPADCDAPSVERAATLTAEGRLEPSNLTVCRGQEVTLAIEVEADGVLHLHGYDDQTPAVSVEAGTPLEMTFEAAHAGQFVIELHATGSSAGSGAGVLTVDER
jgi:hypothetical protein